MFTLRERLFALRILKHYHFFSPEVICITRAMKYKNVHSPGTSFYYTYTEISTCPPFQNVFLLCAQWNISMFPLRRLLYYTYNEISTYPPLRNVVSRGWPQIVSPCASSVSPCGKCIPSSTCPPAPPAPQSPSIIIVLWRQLLLYTYNETVTFPLSRNVFSLYV